MGQFAYFHQCKPHLLGIKYMHVSFSVSLWSYPFSVSLWSFSVSSVRFKKKTMSPWFHPNFPFETLLQWTCSNHHKSCQSLSFWRNFFHRHSNKLLFSLFSKNHLYLTMISTTFVQFQTSTSFPKFSKKLLPPAFNLTCLLTHCLLLFNLLNGSFILLKLLFSKFTMTSS